jgi:O-antigen/teichoic acid export membrane protein
MSRIQALFRRKFVRDTLILQIGKVGVTGLSLLSSILVFRLLGPTSYGVWALAQSFFAISQTFDFTGVELSTTTRLGVAVGAKNEAEILNLLGFYVKLQLIWSAITVGSMALLAPPIARLAYGGDVTIGVLAAWLSLTVLTDAFYNLVIITLQSRRLMAALALLQNVNQVVLVGCIIVALLTSPTPAAMVIARLLYSAVTMFIALIFYAQLRDRGAVPFPTLPAIVKRAWTVPSSPYWRFGVLNAADKNLGSLYTEIPLQLVGIISGQAAAGYLELGFKAMSLPGIFTSAVFENLQAVVPQAIGRRDFVRLWQNFTRVLLSLAGAAALFYAVFVLLVPVVVPVLYGDQAVPALPVITTLSVYGAVTLVGGIFGPLYRALYLLRGVIRVKIVTLAVCIVLGSLLANQWGAVGGAWMVNSLYGLVTLLTAIVTLPVLRNKARERSDEQIQTSGS